MLPPRTGEARLSFNLHNRHTYSEDDIRRGRAYARYLAEVAVASPLGDVLARRYVLNEFRTAEDLFDRVGGGRRAGRAQGSRAHRRRAGLRHDPARSGAGGHRGADAGADRHRRQRGAHLVTGPPGCDHQRHDTGVPVPLIRTSRHEVNTGSRHRRRRAGGPGGRKSRPGRPVSTFARSRRACWCELAVPFSRPDGFLHHAGPARDRRAAVRDTAREADPGRDAALLPPRRRHVRSGHRLRLLGDRDPPRRRRCLHGPHDARRTWRAGVARQDRGHRQRLL